MARVIPALEVPLCLRAHLKTFSSFFPDKVRFNKSDQSVQFTEEMSFELRVSMSYFKFITDVEDVMENLELVLADMLLLSSHPPVRASEGDRRYFLLTKLFFYELLRVRDAFQRFLKRLEQDGLMSKEDRRSTRQLIEEPLSEHYLVRNVYLHGHSLPRSDEELDLLLLRMTSEAGYQERLVPLNGGPPLEYPHALRVLATKRRDGLREVASDMVSFFQNIINTTAEWTSHHRFAAPAQSEP